MKRKSLLRAKDRIVYNGVFFWPLVLCEITWMNLHSNIIAIFTNNRATTLPLHVFLPNGTKLSTQGARCAFKDGRVVVMSCLGGLLFILIRYRKIGKM